MTSTGPPDKQGLYDPRYEHDACGVGFVVDMHGRKSHDLVEKGLRILLNLEHRGGFLRIGLVHYNTAEEIEHLLAALDEL